MPKIPKPTHITCKQRQLGKQTRVSLKSKEHSASKGLVIHTYLCGPPKTQSMQGDRYFMLLIDSYSSITSINFLKEKSKDLDKLKLSKH